ncbi:Ethylene-overproduction protein 1 [Acorus calamus]|uniref:Ethylene-overproduction protein 1 n=1 Tax=Acorus calamus TaxID=4465 RepID=A0AAV9CJP5_ACOCL|nr:Ethylene-overproduction protein 1 [Acorus calamus]
MLYYPLTQVSMEEDMRSNTMMMLLKRLSECASSGWQRQLAMHQLGCNPFRSISVPSKLRSFNRTMTR